MYYLGLVELVMEITSYYAMEVMSTSFDRGS